METKKSDSWEVRIKDFSNVIGKSVEETEEMFNNEMLGLTKDTPNVLYMLSNEEITPFGDLRNVFCNIHKIPVPLLRMGMKFLRGDKEEKEKLVSNEIDTSTTGLLHKYGVKTDIEDLTIEQLMEYYEPTRRNRLSNVLKTKYQDIYGPFIAFKPGTDKVAVNETINYVVDLEMGGEPAEFIEVDGDPVPLYSVNEIPNRIVDEDPLYPGFKLTQERSTKNRISWKNVPLKTRQFYRVLYRRNEISRDDRIALSNIIGKDLTDLKDIFPEAYIEFVQLQKEGNLDNLKISIGSSAKKTNNPF